LKAFNIERSLSAKGSPYDNAVAEAAFKSSRLNLPLITSLIQLKNLKGKYLIMSIGTLPLESMAA